MTAEEGGFKMQDELVTLFSQNMSFSNAPGATLTITKDGQRDHSTPPPYSISMHYHHSGHLVPKTIPPTVSQPQRVISLVNPHDRIKDTLAANGINPSCLIASQLTLFEQAAPDQRSRLMELWRISPPNYANRDQETSDGLGPLQHTTLEQEEETAKLRFQSRETQGLTTQVDMDMNQDDHMEESGSSSRLESHVVEPYMKSGYEMLAQRDYFAQDDSAVKNTFSPLGSAVGNRRKSSTDPVFDGREWWRHDCAGQQPMEHQYGMFDQMNQLRAPTHVWVGPTQEDEEML